MFEWIRHFVAEHRKRRTKALVAAAVEAVMRQHVPGDVWLVVDKSAPQGIQAN